MKNKIAVFDACGTITKTNNTFHFINYVLRKDNKFKLVIFKLILLFSLFINSLKINRLIKKDIVREWSIKLLRGFSVNLIEKRAKEYIDKVEKNYLNPEIMGLIKKEKKRKKEVIIISSSIDPPIKELAKRLGICYVSSELEIINGIYSGNLKKDLLGKKELAVNFNNYDLKNSSVYSDNIEDKDFMLNFGKFFPIIKDSNKNLWHLDGNANFIYLKKEKQKERDTNSVNKRTVKWVYVPMMYYIISRFHLFGLAGLFLKELIPFTLASYFFTNLGIKSFIVVPLSIIGFYSIYEIGGLYNDLKAPEEKKGTPTIRINPKIKINVLWFIIIRIIFLFVLLISLVRMLKSINSIVLFLIFILITLIIYLIHSNTSIKNRIFTFILLKIFRTLTPLIIFFYFIQKNVFIGLCSIFIIIDALKRIYNYLLKQNRIKKKAILENKFTYSITALILSLFWIPHSFLFLIPVYFLLLYLSQKIIQSHQL